MNPHPLLFPAAHLFIGCCFYIYSTAFCGVGIVTPKPKWWRVALAVTCWPFYVL